MEEDTEKNEALTVGLPPCPEGYEQVAVSNGPSMQFNSFPQIDEAKEWKFGQVFGNYPN